MQALMRGRAQVVGGDLATRRGAALNAVLPGEGKARRIARSSRPD
ncbi:hypothetical protein SGUI_0508 [Serinicoccus hydrothermalis]|uniref:Uncharacterized protein n=1 Tax=Serinicoccus hydrothermalis TaxID=1758689 RepID=A0A1B1N924_9MICO|nr:hypothetical protein SGUI_0508 [Serinicoccus hydrothermalis]